MFEIGDLVSFGNGVGQVKCVDNEWLWIEVSGGYVTSQQKDCRHVKSPDADVLTVEWLMQVGLSRMDSYKWRIVNRFNSWWIDSTDRVHYIETALKTVGDARILVSLLNRKLEE